MESQTCRIFKLCEFFLFLKDSMGLKCQLFLFGEEEDVVVSCFILRKSTYVYVCYRDSGSLYSKRVVVWKIIHFLSLEMSCTIEKALADAKALVERLREHDNAAEALIEQTTALNKRVEAMKQVCFSTLFTPSGVELGNTSFKVISVVCYAM